MDTPLEALLRAFLNSELTDYDGEAEAPTGYFTKVSIPDAAAADELIGQFPDTVGAYGVPSRDDLVAHHVVSVDHAGFIAVASFADESSAQHLYRGLQDDYGKYQEATEQP